MKKQRKILPVWLFFVIYGAVVAVCIALDQITKHFMQLHNENGGGDIPIIGNWLVMHYTENSGATGSLFSNLPWNNWLFFGMTLVGLPVFGWLLWRSRKRSVWGQVAFSFIIAGTLGNAIDRLFLAEGEFFSGKVRDFIQVQNFFGIFNIADSFLVVGVFLAVFAIVFFDPDSLLRLFLRERKRAKNKKAEALAAEQSQQPESPEIQIDTPETDGTIETTTDAPEKDGAEHTDEKD